MALLTDPNQESSRIKTILMEYQYVIYVLMYLSSIIFMCLLPLDHFSSETHFSENALLPGLVQGEYNEEMEANKLYRELLQISNDSIPVQWICDKFRYLNIECYFQNFDLQLPFLESNITGTNVYGILRAPRGAGTEALVLSMPYRKPTKEDTSTLPSLALMMSVSKFFRRQKYWARDIIFVITEHEQIGIQAWLDSYHADKREALSVIKKRKLTGRSGTIMAAINIEIPATYISHIDLKVLGLNGALPNLDLVNLVHKICSKEGVFHTFDNKDTKTMRHAREWWSKLKTMFAMIMDQATGVPDGNHGLFRSYGIQAVTLQGYQDTTHAQRRITNPTSFHEMGRVVEGLFRSLNNLLEKFHQSYFFYLLLSNDRFVSIPLYMPCAVMLVVILFLKPFTLWFELTENEKRNQRLEKSEGQYSQSLYIHSSFAIFSVIHALCLLLLPAIEINSEQPKLLFIHQNVSIYHVLGVFFCTSLSPILCRWMFKPETNWNFFGILCFLEISIMLLSISMFNFALGYVLGLLFTLPCVLVTSSQTRFRSLMQKVLWLLVHPLLLLFWIVLVVNVVFARKDASGESILLEAVTDYNNAVTSTMTDYLVYGNSTYVIIANVLIPNWTMFWCLINMRQTLKPKEKTS